MVFFHQHKPVLLELEVESVVLEVESVVLEVVLVVAH